MRHFRRFHDTQTLACSYLLGSDVAQAAVLIDPMLDYVPLYLSVMEELGLHLVQVLETHVHADFLSGAAALQQMTGAQVFAGDKDMGKIRGGEIQIGDLAIRYLPTPGHSAYCLSYCCEDRVFTGESLLIGAWGATNEPESNPGLLFSSINQRLMSLPDEYLLFPGKTPNSRWVSCIGEERRNNPACHCLSRDEFIARCHEHEVPLTAERQQFLSANQQAHTLCLR